MADADRDAIDALNACFERLAAWSFDHRWLVLAGCLVVLGGFAGLAGEARFDNSFESMFDADDPVYVTYTRFREDFGADEFAYLVYQAPETRYGPFDLEVMRKVARLTEALEREVPFVDEVTSLVNVEYVEGVPDGLEIYELLEDFPATQEALLEVRDKALAQPLYVGGLVSRDATHAAIVVEMDRASIDPVDRLRLDPEGGDGLDNLYPQVSYHAIEEILARPEYAGLEFHHVGRVALSSLYNEIVPSESGALGAISFGVIGLLLAVFFRRFVGVAGPLVLVAVSIVVAIGFVGLLDWKLDLMFVILPTLLVAVGVADAVHVLAEYLHFHDELGDRREAVRRALHLVGTPCLLTSVTTAIGFASMSVSPIKSMAHFAVYSALGVMAAFALSVTLLLVFLSFGRRAVDVTGRARRRDRGLRPALAALARFDIRHRRALLAGFAAVFAVSALGMTRIGVDSNFLHEFSKEEPLRRATEYVEDVMGGTSSVVYLFESRTEAGVADPAFLQDIAGLQAAADAQSHLVRKTYSIGDVLKDINQSFHEEDPAYYVLPDTEELAAQYLLVYESAGGEEVESYVSSDFERASLELRCKQSDTSDLRAMADELDAYLERHPLAASQASITGDGALWLALRDYITQSQIRGFLLAFGVIAALLCLVFRSLKTGLIAMVPNLAPVVLTLGVMGWLGLPLDYLRLLIASVAIGISVDDTIHHLSRFRLEFRRCGSYERALEAAMVGVGRPLFITSVVLVAGFLVYLLARMDSLTVFGSLLATTIAFALVANFLLLPALVLTLRPFGPEHAGRAA